MRARRVVVGSLLLIAAGSGCSGGEYEVCARTPDEVERPLHRARTAAELAGGAHATLDDSISEWLATQPPPPAPLPPRPPISLGFIGDAPLQPIPPVQDPPWMHFSCGQCDPDYELP
jgi:hypothetical protein